MGVAASSGKLPASQRAPQSVPDLLNDCEVYWTNADVVEVFESVASPAKAQRRRGLP